MGILVLDTLNPNQGKYPGQRIFFVSINDYPYCIPYVTIIPSWKFKKYLRGTSHE